MLITNGSGGNCIQNHGSGHGSGGRFNLIVTEKTRKGIVDIGRLHEKSK